MKKTIFSLSAALLLSGTLVGCGTNNGAVGNGHNNNGVRPIGYYNGNGNTGMNNGPGVNNGGHFGYNNPNNMNPNNNPNNNNRFGYNHRLNNDRDNDLGLGNGVIDHNGANDPNGPFANGAGKYKQQARTIADRVADMRNVENASVVVTDNDVLIGVKTNDKTSKKLKSGIRRTAQSVVKGKDIHVATTPKMFNRIKNVHNNLQDGNTMNEVSSDISGIINDLGNAAKRPFQNNAR